MDTLRKDNGHPGRPAADGFKEINLQLPELLWDVRDTVVDTQAGSLPSHNLGTSMERGNQTRGIWSGS